MAVVIGGVVSQATEGKRVLVDVLRLVKQRLDEIAAANIVREVREEMVAERIIAHVLDDAAAIGVGVRFTQIVGRCSGETREQNGLYVFVPGGIDHGLVGENRVGTTQGAACEQQANWKKASHGYL